MSRKHRFNATESDLLEAREQELDELYYTCECWGPCFCCGNPDCGGCFGCCGVGLNEDDKPYAESKICPCKEGNPLGDER